MNHLFAFLNGFRIPNTIRNEMESVNVITKSVATDYFVPLCIQWKTEFQLLHLASY